jgi:hypothetical protein
MGACGCKPRARRNGRVFAYAERHKLYFSLLFIDLAESCLTEWQLLGVTYEKPCPRCDEGELEYRYGLEFCRTCGSIEPEDYHAEDSRLVDGARCARRGGQATKEFMSVDNPREIWEFLKEEQFTAQDLAELRKSVAKVTNFQNEPLYRSLNIRASIETLDSLRLLRESIDRFDHASGEMVKRGNRINSWVLVFAVVAAALGVASIWISVLSYQLALAQVGK